jgi:hypothetical protein
VREAGIGGKARCDFRFGETECGASCKSSGCILCVVGTAQRGDAGELSNDAGLAGVNPDKAGLERAILGGEAREEALVDWAFCRDAFQFQASMGAP